MDKDDTVKVLNDLIETSEDGKNGFTQAAEKVTDSQLKTVLSTRAQSCEMAARELQQLVQSLGGKPEQSGHISGAVHRGWMNIKSMAGDANARVLEEVERGEDVAKAAYSKALQADLPPQVRQIVEKQYQGVVQNHDRVRQLRNQFQTSS